MKIYEIKVEATNHHGNIKALCEITKKHFDNSQKDFGSGNMFKCKEFKKHPNTKHLKKRKMGTDSSCKSKKSLKKHTTKGNED